MPRPKKEKEAKATVGAGVTPCAAPGRLKGKMAGKSSAWSIFDQDDFVEQQKELMGFAKDSLDFLATDEVNTEVLPLPWPALQFLIGRIGIPVQTFTQIIGPEGVTKSTMAMSMAYHFVRNNIPVLYLLSEPKELQSDWVMRLAGKDPTMAAKIAHKVPRVVASSYVDMDDKARDWVLKMRKDMKVPMDIPLVVIIDSLSHMRTPNEEEVQRSSKKGKDGDPEWSVVEKGYAEMGGRIGSAATFMASWCRLFSSVMKAMNVTVIAVSGQSVKLPVGQGPAAMALCTDSNNGESIGGKAIKKAAAIRINVTRGPKLTKGSGDSAVIYGAKIKLKLLKNSVGPDTRKVTFDLRSDDFNDTVLPGDPDEDGNVKEVVTELDQAINMDSAFCDALCYAKACGFSCAGGLYTSKEFGIERMRAGSVMRLLEENEGMMVKACRALKIAGYEEV